MGSNIEPEQNLLRAVQELDVRVEVVAVSRVFETEPVGRRRVPTFLNAAVELNTSLTPRALKFRVLRSVEAALGRVRTHDRNAPRVIDLDIALFGDRMLSDPAAGIEIPDPDIVRHPHVVVPLADLAPDRRHPESGETLREIAANLAPRGRVRLASEASALRNLIAELRSARSFSEPLSDD